MWPEHTRYLDLWASQLDTARRALAGPPPSYRPLDPDDAAVLGRGQGHLRRGGHLVRLPAAGRTIAETGRDTRHRLYRPDWSHMIIATAAARLYRKIFAAEAAEPGRWPLAIDRDNLLYAADDPDPDRPPRGLIRQARPAEPDGNALGQVKNKGSALTAEAGPLLAAGRFSFDET